MQKTGDKLFLLCLAVILAVLLYARFNFRHIPFERDEGEYAYAGSLLLHGHHPYKEAYNMKFPGTYFMYAVLMKLGGESIEAVRTGVCFIILFTAFLIGIIAYMLTGNVSASALALVIFVALTNTMGGEGLMANAEDFVVFFAVSGIFLLLFSILKYSRLYLIFLSGVMLGTSVFMKQYGYPFCLFSFGLLLAYNFRKPFSEMIKPAAIFILGGLVPVVLLLTWLLKNGLWDKFEFFTLKYSLAYLKYYPTDSNVVSAHTGELIALGLLIAVSVLFYVRKDKLERIVIAWVIFSIPAVSTGGLFRLHYFILAYPALATAAAFIYFKNDSNSLPRAVMAKVASIILLCLFIFTQKDVVLAANPTAVFNKHYADDYFAEMPQIAEQINKMIPPGDRLSLFSREPELLFYSHRVAASGYMYNYPLIEPQPYALQMTDEYIREVEANPSRLFVYQPPPEVYNVSSFAYFSKWWNAYSKKFYLKGLYYCDSDTSGGFLWDEQLIEDSSWKESDRIEFWLRKE